jgi:hypothetical protein
MKSQINNSKGISEVVSVTLVILLILALSLITYGAVSGWLNPKYMQKSVYVAASAKETQVQSTGLPYNLLTFNPEAGDPFYINSQSPASGTKTTLRVISPDGRNLTPDASGLASPLYGKTLYIYQKTGGNSCDYGISDKVPGNLNSLPAMVIGRYQLQLIDENTHILANSFAANITRGTTSLPVTVLTGTGTGVGNKADCSQLPGSCPKGCPSLYNTSPCNRTYSKYNGSTYLSFPDDPTLKYTGDFTLSAFVKPTATGSMSSSANWHQIVGKGSIDASNNEIDNYQLFQVGDQLLFEWNDKTTGIHYQGITNTSPVTTNWNDIAVTVANGNLQIYVNGVAQPLHYNQGTDPTHVTIPTTNPPKVNLIDTTNDVSLGKQNGYSVANNFNFVGDIGPVAMYNRALTQAEITGNLCTG